MDASVKPPRSQAAKERIMQAARAVFSEAGYDRATVRQIAERASVAPAMLVRYFGGKAGVFSAAVTFDLSLPGVGDAGPDAAGRMLVAHFLDRWGDGGGDLVALLRASVDHPEAREKMLSIFADQLAPVVAQAAGPGDHGRTAALVASQMLGLAFCRFVLDVPSLREVDREEMVDRVGRTIANYLRGD